MENVSAKTTRKRVKHCCLLFVIKIKYFLSFCGLYKARHFLLQLRSFFFPMYNRGIISTSKDTSQDHRFNRWLALPL